MILSRSFHAEVLVECDACGYRDTLKANVDEPELYGCLQAGPLADIIALEGIIPTERIAGQCWMRRGRKTFCWNCSKPIVEAERP